MTVGDQDDLGFNIDQDPHKQLLQITTCRKHTSASKIPRWRSTVRFQYINTINDIPIRTQEELLSTVRKLRKNSTTECVVQLMTDESDAPSMLMDGTPQYILTSSIIYTTICRI